MGKDPLDFESAESRCRKSIRKVIVEIVGYLFSLLLLTLVIDFQMQAPSTCGGDWLNVVALFGACVVVCILYLAIWHQWSILKAIERDLPEPESGHHIGVRDNFRLQIRWSQAALGAVVAAGIGEAAFATYRYSQVAVMTPQPCISGAIAKEEHPESALRLPHFR